MHICHICSELGGVIARFTSNWGVREPQHPQPQSELLLDLRGTSIGGQPTQRPCTFNCHLRRRVGSAPELRYSPCIVFSFLLRNFSHYLKLLSHLIETTPPLRDECIKEMKSFVINEVCHPNLPELLEVAKAVCVCLTWREMKRNAQTETNAI